MALLSDIQLLKFLDIMTVTEMKGLDAVERVSDVDSEATEDCNEQTADTGSDISDLDSESGHVDAALTVTINNSRKFLISSVGQL